MEHELGFSARHRCWELQISGLCGYRAEDLCLDVQPCEIRVGAKVLTRICVPVPVHARLDPDRCLPPRFRSRKGVLTFRWKPVLVEEHSAFRDCALQVLSDLPLVYVCSDFARADECALVIDAARRFGCVQTSDVNEVKYEMDPYPLHNQRLSPATQSVLESIYGRIDALCGVERHTAEQPPRVHHYSPSRFTVGGPAKVSASAASAKAERMKWGVHLDTNGRPWRFATAILYLASLPKAADGATVFPCSGDEVARLAGEALCKADQQHTGNIFDEDLEPEARALVGAAAGGRGLSVRPEAGKLVVFFSRSEDGAVDGTSWHGGARVIESAGAEGGKWILQFFKEVPMSYRSSADAVTRFVRSRRCLPDFALHGVRHRFFASGEQ
eukprot:TRINITY_DN63212_c0_g1_i1.p1 TRINITY_DN63212_c0_g1~~TRINITY_DN63212_c0_g1_i1.p1  ORF type:complete len:385 (+),score=47.79 TRINITY_DN63212_c0_g1_i1:168-1322(+)